MAFHLVGLDLGGTKIATALTDTDSEILRYETVPIDPADGPEAILQHMVASVKRVTEGIRTTTMLGVGVAIAGLVETGTGRVRYSPNLRWRDVDLGGALNRALGYPVYVGNDVAMTALGELHYGAAKGKRDVVVIWVGTGIGAGLVLDGRIYQGARGFAGEIGQMTVDWRGESCPGGNRGCWEGLVSGPALERRALAAIAAGEKTLLSAHKHDMHVEAIMAAHEQGDALALRLVEEAAEILGAGVANVVNLLDPEMVVLGGGVMRSVPVLVERVRGAASKRALDEAFEACEIVPARFGREAGVIGATVLAKLAGNLEPSR